MHAVQCMLCNVCCAMHGVKQIPAVTGTRVTPVVGWLEHDVEGCHRLTLSDGEVEHAFTVPIAHLLDPENRCGVCSPLVVLLTVVLLI